MATVLKWLLLSLALLGRVASAAQAQPTAEETWKASCADCHGADGRAQTKVGMEEYISDFTRAEWQGARSDEALGGTIRDGAAQNFVMKAYKDQLSPSQIDELVKYIRALGASAK